MSLTQALSPVIDLVFPPRCPLCGEGITAQNGVCAACWSQLVIPGEPACDKCSRPFGPDLLNGMTCAVCLEHPPSHDGIAAATIYTEASRKLVLAFKHGNRIALAPMLARLMTARLGFIGPDWTIVPVPLHRWRLWSRGYNQAALLAREIARATGGALCVDAMVRKKATPSLGTMGARERAKALSGAIAVRPTRRSQVAGARIVLVDDVLTSGATSGTCIAALKQAGARRVVIACFSRVLENGIETAPRA